MARLDLDAAKAARREAAAEPLVVVFGGEEFELPVEMPLEVLAAIKDTSEDESDLAQAARVWPLCEALLGADAWERFVGHRPSVEDLLALVDVAFDGYAVDPPKASASTPSSTRSGKRSRPTSSPSTASARGRSSTGRTATARAS